MTCLCAFQGLKVFFDGAARHNSNSHLRRASFGVAYFFGDTFFSYDYGCLGSISCNQAEFSAVVIALHRISSLQFDLVQFFGDSSLVVDVFNGAKSLYSTSLERLFILGNSFMAFMPSTRFTFQHIPRAQNYVADYLANAALNFDIRPTMDLGNPFSLADAYLSTLSPLASFLPSSVDHDEVGSVSVLDIFNGSLLTSPDLVRIRDPSLFQAGSVHDSSDFWLSFITSSEAGDRIRKWLRFGVDITEFFQHFTGDFDHVHYDSDTPPSCFIPNHNIDPSLRDWVTSQLEKELSWNGVSVWGNVGEVDPPHLVMPVGVEPNKPRKFYDARFLNLWMMDKKFSYEHISMVPFIFDRLSPLWSSDDSNGYFHVKLSDNSRTFFGFVWNDVYYVYNTLCFGWQLSPWVYSIFSGEFAGFMRRLRIPLLYYLDDFLGGPIRFGQRSRSILQRSSAAAFIVISLRTMAGFFVHPVKSSPLPSLWLIWLGIGIDMSCGKFFITEKKLAKLASLWDRLLSSDDLMLCSDAERLLGFLVSLLVCSPGLLFRLRPLFTFLSQFQFNTKCKFRHHRLSLSLSLKFKSILRQFKNVHIPNSSLFRSQEHCVVTFVQTESGIHVVASFQRRSIDRFYPLVFVTSFSALQQSIFLMNALLDFASRLPTSCYIDLLVDRQIWFTSSLLKKQLDESSISDLLLRFCDWISSSNIDIKIVPFSIGPDGWPVDALEHRHYILSDSFFDHLQSIFGIFDVDCCASSFNTRIPSSFCSHLPSLGSIGTNIFAVSIHGYFCYANPPFSLIAPLVLYFRQQRVRAVMIVAQWDGFYPDGYWWDMLIHLAKKRYFLASSHSTGVFVQKPESSGGNNASSSWNVWAYYFDFR